KADVGLNSDRGLAAPRGRRDSHLAAYPLRECRAVKQQLNGLVVHFGDHGCHDSAALQLKIDGHRAEDGARRYRALKELVSSQCVDGAKASPLKVFRQRTVPSGVNETMLVPSAT